MLTAKKLKLTGWGGGPVADCYVVRPEREAELKLALEVAAKGGVIMRGNGRSYGDQATNDGGQVILSERLRRITAFDASSGIVTVEAGITISTLLSFMIKHSLMLPAVPGTSFVTIGGAIANDVHGKGHHKQGSFGNHVRWIDIMLPIGEVRRISPTQDSDLFHATIGGLGLTGIIVQAAIQGIPVLSNAVDLTRRRIANFDGFLEAFSGPAIDADYSVGWIDGMARGRNLGRGYIEFANAAPESIPDSDRRAINVPIYFPNFALNKLSIGAFNTFIYQQSSKEGSDSRIGFNRFFFPLDRIHNWNRIYGRAGFYQLQCLLPHGQAEAGIPRLLEQIASLGIGSFLSVIKCMGREGLGLLSFGGPGITLALDIPRRPGVHEIMTKLNGTVLDHGGRIYLAKDATLSRRQFEQMYPRAEAFCAILALIDSDGRMASDMARRLGLVSAKGALS